MRDDDTDTLEQQRATIAKMRAALDTAEERAEVLREEREDALEALADTRNQLDGVAAVGLSHYASGRYGGKSQVLLTPEASQTLLVRVLQEAGAKIVLGAILVEWETIDRPDIIVFEDGSVREVNPAAQPDKARRIVAAAQGREDGPGKLEGLDHRPLLPRGMLEAAEPDAPRIWAAYLMDDGVWMAHDKVRDRFDARFTWAERWQVDQRVHWLNAHTTIGTGEVAGNET